LTAKPIVMVDAPGGRYWRAAVYNEYSGLGWASNDEINFDFGRGRQPSALPFFRARVPFTQTYTFFQDGATVLYAMASPVRLDRSAIAKVSYVSPDQMDNNSGNPWAGKKQPWLEEVTYIESNRRLLAEEPYQIVSMISIATEEQLRSDSLTYPNWVKERYLQLPDGIPRRVFDLAEEITRDADNRYDKAQAIEEYLRENITYNEKIESPPSDRDKVDYILFDLKEAYCDYYATSMIVMLRSLGIPSRLAAGYARGELETLDNQKKVYVVQSKNAHSWVEVFFPTYGWIEFEPTAAQPVIARRSSANNDLVSDNRGFDRNPLEEEFDPLDRAEDVNLNEGEPLAPFYRIQLPFWGEVKASKGLIRTTVIGLVLLMIGLGGWSLYTHRQQMQPTEVPTVSAVYIAMLKLAAWAGVKKYPSQTAYEHARQVANTLPTVQPEVDLITAEFVRQNFSRFHQTTEEIKSQIAEAWNNVRPKFYRAIFEIRNPLNKIRLPFKW
jgi:transglutaminase-like putative cysteine protease